MKLKMDENKLLLKQLEMLNNKNLPIKFPGKGGVLVIKTDVMTRI